MEQGKIIEAEVLTVRVGATPTGLTAPTSPRPQPQGFLLAGCPSCRPYNSIKALTATQHITGYFEDKSFQQLIAPILIKRVPVHKIKHALKQYSTNNCPRQTSK